MGLTFSMTETAKCDDSPNDHKQKHKHIIIGAIVEKYKLILKPISTKFSPNVSLNKQLSSGDY